MLFRLLYRVSVSTPCLYVFGRVMESRFVPPSIRDRLAVAGFFYYGSIGLINGVFRGMEERERREQTRP